MWSIICNKCRLVRWASSSLCRRRGCMVFFMPADCCDRRGSRKEMWFLQPSFCVTFSRILNDGKFGWVPCCQIILLSVSRSWIPTSCSQYLFFLKDCSFMQLQTLMARVSTSPLPALWYSDLGKQGSCSLKFVVVTLSIRRKRKKKINWNK